MHGMVNLNIIILHDPWRTANSRQILLRGGARGSLLVPRIEDTIPLSILALLHDGAGIHESEEGSPLAAAGVAASDPLVRFLGRRGGRALLSPRRHGGETRLVSLVALQTTDPKAEVLPSAHVLHRLWRGGSFVLLLGGGTLGPLRIALVHVTVPLGGELFGIHDAAKTPPLLALVALNPGGIRGSARGSKDTGLLKLVH